MSPKGTEDQRTMLLGTARSPRTESYFLLNPFKGIKKIANGSVRDLS